MSRSSSLATVKGVADIAAAIALTVAAGLLFASRADAKMLVNNESFGSTFWAPSSLTPTMVEDSSLMVADDFVVPSGRVWQVTKVTAYGTYTQPEPKEVTRASVAFYRTVDGTAPAAKAFRSQSKLKPSGATSDGTIRMKTAMVIPPGRNWISVQPNFVPGGVTQIWGWLGTTENVGLLAHFRNPEGLLNPTCMTWRPLNQCSFMPQSVHFRLDGIVGKNEFRELKSRFRRTPNNGLVYVVKVRINNIGRLKIKANGFKPLKKKVKKIGAYRFVLKPKASTLAKYRAGQPITTRANYKLPALLPKGFTSAAESAVTTGSLRVVADG